MGDGVDDHQAEHEEEQRGEEAACQKPGAFRHVHEELPHERPEDARAGGGLLLVHHRYRSLISSARPFASGMDVRAASFSVRLKLLRV